MDPFQFGIQTGEISLQQLLTLPNHERKAIIEQGLFIDIYLGNTRVYKRTSKTLLFAFCSDIGRFLEPLSDRFIVRLPHGLSNSLTVKLAVLYMEQYLLNHKVRSAPWKIRRDIAPYVCLAELFAFIGMAEASRKLETAILRRFREVPLRIEQIRAIWGREDGLHPSRYAKIMADNVFTFLCVPKMEFFAKEHDIEPAESYEKEVKRKLECLAKTYPQSTRRAIDSAWRDTSLLERVLDAPANVLLKQLVWTANTLSTATPRDPAEWIEIAVMMGRVASHPHPTTIRKIVLRERTDLESDEETELGTWGLMGYGEKRKGRVGC
ncbi:hypothetical protein P153DRAFT_376285 [Dothidotthia symphoricarpi CBS 119687]|uniref:Uncharacterized protein n=1 Tax=Dothidotthia symphoricarpi CBS 119687 TaxID=1392245 RepID=A0A6A6ABK0_9PLEO|nr:uncharacterized protein P153DRAFT_376285 [Dothidotthia symphoricarpi CBS 119687]KAF2128956.1 hypothetical protein P153DRAFT_376285 [Dothidotthia symphoricarpi CBS 119687]